MWRWFNTIIATNTFSENAAHILMGYAAILTGYRFHWPMFPLTAGCLALAALKEYGWDARWEIPHQTFVMNTTDFLGYCLGLGIGLLVTHGA